MRRTLHRQSPASPDKPAERALFALDLSRRRRWVIFFYPSLMLHFSSSVLVEFKTLPAFSLEWLEFLHSSWRIFRIKQNLKKKRINDETRTQKFCPSFERFFESSELYHLVWKEQFLLTLICVYIYIVTNLRIHEKWFYLNWFVYWTGRYLGW